MKTAECMFVGEQGGTDRIALFIEIKELDDTRSIVNIYVFGERWQNRGKRAADKLIKTPR